MTHPHGGEPLILSVHYHDETTHLSLKAGQSVRDALDQTELRVRAACGGTGSCGACGVRILSGAVTPPTASEYVKLDRSQREQGLRLACQLRLTGPAEITLDDPAPASPWKSIPDENLFAQTDALPQLERHIYGLAVDLGTTHIRLALWDRKTGRRIATRIGQNPQIAFGADVLNRISGALSSPDHAAEIAGLARDAILRGLHDMLARDVGLVTPMLADIGQVVLVGNTAMLSLLTRTGTAALLDPSNWLASIDYQPADMAEWPRQWGLPNATFLFPPPIAGFIGCDLLAASLAVKIIDGASGTLLLDFGTNTEIALWDGETLFATSVPGGSAFEGGGVQNGMGAEVGAIYRVEPCEQGVSCDVLGGGEAKGFCGSGLIDGLAILLESDQLKPSGRFAAISGGLGVALIPGIARSVITGSTVDSLQRAKAAVAAAVEVLVAASSLGDGNIKRLTICGAFGHHLTIANALRIGLLPTGSFDHLTLHADAALAGAEKALLHEDGARLFKRLLDKTKGINLSMIDSYEDCFVSHLRLRPFQIKS